MRGIIPTPMILESSSVIPVMAALPYAITGLNDDLEPAFYEPATQLMICSRGNYSTCRYDESAGGWFSSKSDTKKDD